MDHIARMWQLEHGWEVGSYHHIHQKLLSNHPQVPVPPPTPPYPTTHVNTNMCTWKFGYGEHVIFLLSILYHDLICFEQLVLTDNWRKSKWPDLCYTPCQEQKRLTQENLFIFMLTGQVRWWVSGYMNRHWLHWARSATNTVSVLNKLPTHTRWKCRREWERPHVRSRKGWHRRIILIFVLTGQVRWWVSSFWLHEQALTP